MDKIEDEKWFNEILRIEQQNPKKNRKNPLKSPGENDEYTEEQLDDYFMIFDRIEYLKFIKNHKEMLSKESYQWLYEDLPFCVDEQNRVTYEDLEARNNEVENV